MARSRSLGGHWASALAVGFTLVSRAEAQPRSRLDAVARLVAGLRPVAMAKPAVAPELPRIAWTPNGALRYLGAPPGTAFSSPTPGEPEVTALGFLRAERELLSVADPVVDFRLEKGRARGVHRCLRFQQTWAGLPVFAAQASVQLDEAGGVEAVIADLATGYELSAESLSVAPAISAARAIAEAERFASLRARGARLETRTPALVIFAPRVVGIDGPPRLVWEVVTGARGRPGSSFRVLVDARDGRIASAFPLDFATLDRRIMDSNNTTSFGTTVRTEGQLPCGIFEADRAYDFLGDTYAFYVAEHGRNGIPNYDHPIYATVRFCDQPVPCPWPNAYYSFGELYFGDGYTVDDVIAHEYTHGVTAYESDLVYANDSGAMNESLSDCWGEFVDLTNGHGNDSPGVRWLHGEDLPDGAGRDMKNPPAFDQPDRRWSSLYVPRTSYPTQDNDYGGVHTNSGVNNKLCYLLTDGDTFNGQTVTGLGISRIADLYYEANTNLLTSGADWDELWDVLQQAAINLGWSSADRTNLVRACLAVEIASYVVDAASGCAIQSGAPTCDPSGGPYQTVAAANGGVPAGATLTIRAGSYPGALTLGRRAHFTSEGGSARVGP